MTEKQSPTRRDWRHCAALVAVAVVAACTGCGDSSDSESARGGPQIAIIDLKAGDGEVHGSTKGADPATMRVVLYAKTDQWYVQPFIASPITTIAEDGTWYNTTHPWNHLLALLVDDSYQHVNTSVRHPASAPGVLAWDEFPTRTDERTVQFSGRTWVVKTGDLAGPGPNYFSDSEESVAVDGDGLHLAIRKDGDRWYTAEVFLHESLGYGTYRFTVSTRLDALDPNVVFAGFTYESVGREIDVEFSPFLANPQNAQYVVQPYTVPGNLVRFDMPSDTVTTHEFEWRADHISFRSWRGSGAFSDDVAISSSTYTGTTIPPPGGERMHFNYWLFDGHSPATGTDSQITVTHFEFVP